MKINVLFFFVLSAFFYPQIEPPEYLEKGKSYPEGSESEHSGAAVYSSDGSDLVSLAYSNSGFSLKIKFEEGDLSDALVTEKLKVKIIELAKLVEKEWEKEGVSLRITEAWDTNSEHKARYSLHYEGRAVDLTTSDRDKKKLSRLGGLAIKSGFSWVKNEGDHIHASVIK